MRLYPILVLSVLGLAGCAREAAAPASGSAASGSGTVLHTSVPPALLAEIVARAAPPRAAGNTRLAALPVVTDATPSAAAGDAGATGGFDADGVDAAIDALGAIIRAARAAPPPPASGAAPPVTYTLRLDRGATVQIAQPWRPGDPILGPRERAAIRIVGGAREVVPEDSLAAR